MKLSRLTVIDNSDINAKGWDKRSRVKDQRVKRILTQVGHFRTVTPVSIHVLRSDAQSLEWHIVDKFIRRIPRSHVTKIRQFCPNWGFLDCDSSLISQIATIRYIKLEEVPYRFSNLCAKFRGHLGQQVDNLAQITAFPSDKSNLNSRMVMKWHTAAKSMEELPYCFSRPCVQYQGQTGKKWRFAVISVFPDDNSNLNSLMTIKWRT